MKSPQRPPGQTQAFVLPQGFVEKHGRLLLADEDSHPHLFFELTADPDHTQTNFNAAFEILLAGMFPGVVFRILRLTLPSTEPRTAFFRQLMEWPLDLKAGGGSLRQTLEEYLRQAPVPFHERTILELVVPSQEILDWAESIPAQLSPSGIAARPLAPTEVQELARWLFNPEF